MVLLSPIFFLFYIFTDFLFSNSRSPEWDMNGNLSSQPQQRLYVFLFSCLTSCFTYCEICCSVHRMAMSSLWIVLCLVAQSCPTLCYSMDYVACQAPLSMGILQARILEWVAMPSSRGSSRPRDWTHVSCVACIAGRFITTEPPRKPFSLITDSILPTNESKSQTQFCCILDRQTQISS